MIGLGSITLAQAAKAVGAYFSVLLTVLGLFWTVAKPRAEDFVRQTVQQEKFATHEELEKQTKALEDLSETVKRQSDAINNQAAQMGVVQSDVGTIKQLQKDTLRAILKLPDE